MNKLISLLRQQWWVCKHAKDKGILVQLEIFDFDIDKKALIGPAPLALKYTAAVRTEVNNFGLMVDLSHFPQTYETSEEVISSLRPYITHLRIGNAVLKEGAPAYGDLHSRMGFPNSANNLYDMVDFFEVCDKYGLLNKHRPIYLSFEVKLIENEDPDMILRIWTSFYFKPLGCS